MAPPILSFLHPLPLPRPQTIQSFLRTLSTTTSNLPPQNHPPPSLSTRSLTKSSRPAQPIASNQVPNGLPTTNQIPSHPALKPLTYHVHRTASKQLPVYLDAKRGGNLHQTLIRKIEGNVEDLRDELKEALRLEEGKIAINYLTRHVVIKV
jgi:large subunit ribosomal protein L49